MGTVTKASAIVVRGIDFVTANIIGNASRNPVIVTRSNRSVSRTASRLRQGR